MTIPTGSCSYSNHNDKQKSKRTFHLNPDLDLLQTPILDPYEFRILFYLRSLNPCHPKIATIAKSCGISERKVKNALLVLKRLGYILIKSGRGGKGKDRMANEYFVRLGPIQGTDITRSSVAEQPQIRSFGDTRSGRHIKDKINIKDEAGRHNQPDLEVEKAALGPFEGGQTSPHDSQRQTILSEEINQGPIQGTDITRSEGTKCTHLRAPGALQPGHQVPTKYIKNKINKNIKEDAQSQTRPDETAFGPFEGGQASPHGSHTQERSLPAEETNHRLKLIRESIGMLLQ